MIISFFFPYQYLALQFEKTIHLPIPSYHRLPSKFFFLFLLPIVVFENSIIALLLLFPKNFIAILIYFFLVDKSKQWTKTIIKKTFHVRK